MPASSSPSKVFTLLSVLIAGACWHFSFSLSGDVWYLMWVAPVPVLYVSFYLKGWQAFVVAFVAYLIGRLSWLPYLLSVIPAPLAIVFTVLLPLIFALLAVATRRVTLATSHWAAVFTLPVLVTSVEYLTFLFSRDGTIISIAYTQCNFLQIVQVASVTGIQGITFLATLVPSAIALIAYRYKLGRSIRPLAYTTAAILCVALVFGQVRLMGGTTDVTPTSTVGMASIDESVYKNTLEPNSSKEIAIAGLYINEVSMLANNGAQVLVLPEKALIVNDSTAALILQMFADTAKARQVYIVVGVTKIKKGYYENNAWVISDEGKLVTDYQKVNLFEGEAMEGFKPGNAIGLLQRNNQTEGVAICKDLDFQQYIHRYAKAKSGVLYVPGWDFVRDGWLHSRMAMMRSVEGGYGMVRNAREGRLTISDYRGQVLYEARSEAKTTTELTGKFSSYHHTTIYSIFGDWFSMVNLIAAVWFIFIVVRKKRAENLINDYVFTHKGCEDSAGVG